MNTITYFIANRLGTRDKQSFTGTITKLAIGSVSLSILVMILSSVFINGFKKEIKTKIYDFWGHIVINDSNINLDSEMIPISLDSNFVKDLESIDYVSYTKKLKLFNINMDSRTHGGIKKVQSFAVLGGIISTKDDFEGINIKGLGPEYDSVLIKKYLIQGKILDLKSSEPKREIILSEKTANRLKLKLNDKLILNFVLKNEQVKRAFEISGIYKTGLVEYDRVFALVDLRHIQDLLHWDRSMVGGVEVIVDDIRDIETINDYIYSEKLPLKYFSQTIRHKNPAIFDWLDLQDINGQVILLLMIIVAIINLATALLILIIDRTRMVGILKVLGMQNVDIQKVFLHYARIILTKGLVFGNIIGLLLAYLQDIFHFIKLSEDDYYLAYAPVDFNWTEILLINVLSAIIILIALILPTIIITKIKPIRAIRFD